MPANIAGIRLSLDGGPDLAEKVKPRLLELTLSEKREDEADELSITLHNHDGALAVPEPGVGLLLQLGWLSGADDIPVGMVDKGKFIVDEVGQEGPPDKVTIRARSADLTGLYRKRRTKSWRDTTLGAILGDIAGRHGVTARIAGGLADAPVATLEQEGVSDMAFVRELGRKHDAIATWKGGFLLFAPIGLSAAIGGAPLASAVLTKRDGWTWSFAQASRDDYDGAEAQWHDQGAGRRRTVSTGGEKPRRLRRVYATEQEARQAAAGAASRDKRRPYSFEYELAIADPALQPDVQVTLQGWSAKIDGLTWLIQSVETTLGAAGLTQRITMESA